MLRQVAVLWIFHHFLICNNCMSYLYMLIHELRRLLCFFSRQLPMHLPPGITHALCVLAELFRTCQAS